MSQTLFWYLFKDLLRIFLLTTMGLAGIMSFAGLLRPLTEHGLDGTQVARMLAYLTPGMMTYSLPIAALFATAMVYGRLSADNEVTACRAGGISYLSLATPAVVLGLIVAIISLLSLSFIVPVFTLKVEKVIYSNVARMVASQIERTRSVRFGDHMIFAREAILPEDHASDPDRQMVILRGLMIMSYEPLPENQALRVPREYWLARQANVHIHRTREEDYQMDVELLGGATFPRSFEGAIQGGVETQHFGPLPLESQIRERTKFMDIRQLKLLHQDLGQSATIRRLVRDFLQNEQETEFARLVAERLDGPYAQVVFRSGADEFILTRGDATPQVQRRDVLLRASAGLPAGGQARTVRFRQQREGHVTLEVQAQEGRIRSRADNDNDRMIVTVEMHDALVHSEAEPVPRGSFPRTFSIPMPREVMALRQARTADYYVAGPEIRSPEHRTLKREYLRLGNGVYAEMHGRAALAVSCMVLVMVGCALGLMFSSGNFLSAFALSVIPALLTIALIIMGQRTAENIPRELENLRDPLWLGIGLIWSGNVAVLGIGVALLARLQRQ